MLDRLLRPLKDRGFEPVARLLGRRIHPNVFSAAALLAGLASAYCCGVGNLRAGLIWWAVNRLLDGLDGVVARVDGRQTDFGGYLDIVFDFVAYAAIPVGLAWGLRSLPVDRAALVLLASFLVNAASWMWLAAVFEQRNLGARSRGETTSITMPGGLIAGTETMVFYTLFFALPDHLVTLFWVMAALVLLTAAERMVWAARHLRAWTSGL